jgi:hypothetical protein
MVTNLLQGQAAMGQAAVPNALSDTMRPRRVTNIERNPTTPLEDTVRPRPKFHQVLGRVGDIMAMMGGRDPLFERYAAMERAQEDQAMQQNALAQFFQPGGGLEEYAPLAQAGMGLPQIAQIAGMRQGPQDKMTSLMQEVQAATGFAPGTPEFQSALTTEMNNRRLSGALVGGPDTGYQVNPMFRPLGGQAPAPAQGQPAAPMQAPMQAPAQAGGNVVTMQDLQTIARSFPNADAMMQWMRGNNVAVQVNTPQEAMNLPSGTRIVTPDGREKVVP